MYLILFSTHFSILALLFIVYCLLFVKIVRNEYEYQDKFLICVNEFGNKPLLILILTSTHKDQVVSYRAAARTY